MIANIFLMEGNLTCEAELNRHGHILIYAQERYNRIGKYSEIPERIRKAQHQYYILL